MVSKNQIKLIKSLQQKKYRMEHNFFVAEGIKVIEELLQSKFELVYLFETDELFDNVVNSKKIKVQHDDLKKMTSFSTPSNCLAVFRIPEEKDFEDKGLIVVLDDIRDPGNLGTIIRLCDWFGIKQIVCSKETVDVYNPKVVQSTMGSISRVNIFYTDLKEYIKKSEKKVYGTYMDGKSIYNEKLSSEGIVVFGNEANGISKELESLISDRIAIPRFGELQKTESLNVATAAAIVLSEFKRNS